MYLSKMDGLFLTQKQVELEDIKIKRILVVQSDFCIGIASTLKSICNCSITDDCVTLAGALAVLSTTKNNTAAVFCQHQVNFVQKTAKQKGTTAGSPGIAFAPLHSMHACT